MAKKKSTYHEALDRAYATLQPEHTVTIELTQEREAARVFKKLEHAQALATALNLQDDKLWGTSRYISGCTVNTLDKAWYVRRNDV